jgi:hypothetical protein
MNNDYLRRWVSQESKNQGLQLFSGNSDVVCVCHST